MLLAIQKWYFDYELQYSAGIVNTKVLLGSIKWDYNSHSLKAGNFKEIRKRKRSYTQNFYIRIEFFTAAKQSVLHGAQLGSQEMIEITE